MTKLTVGMATAFDFQGLRNTILDINLNNEELVKDIEIVIVDNTPESRSGELIRGSLNNGMCNKFGNDIYVGYTEKTGTSAPRDYIFEVAKSPHVLVLDSHVNLQKGAIKKLMGFYAENPETEDLYQGSLLSDSLQGTSSHFSPVWSSQMYGVWGRAWSCKCKEGVKFSVEIGHPNKSVYFNLMSRTPLTSCFNCESVLPEIMFAEHEKNLKALGYVILDEQEEKFEIPGQGLGLFSCKRDSWLGFNEDALGFGGEELYIHEKYRQAGRKCWNLPFLKWVHRFGRECQEGQYTLTVENKVRNYILEWNELGKSLDDIHKHFVTDQKAITEKVWEKMVSNPKKKCSTCGTGIEFDTLEEVYEHHLETERDLNQHMPKLLELAHDVNYVTDISIRRESLIAFLYAAPKMLTSYNAEWNGTIGIQSLEFLGKDSPYNIGMGAPETIEATDLLFLNTTHTFNVVYQQLQTYSKFVSRYIVLHNTDIYGQLGEDGGKGILPAVAQFLRSTAGEEWSVIYHTKEQYGLLVLGCQQKDKPKLPSKFTMAKNYAKFLIDYATSGMKDVEQSTLENRLNVCSTCPARNGVSCSACGCPTDEKASKAVSSCPLGLWDKV